MTTEVQRPFYIKSAYIFITATLVVLILYLAKIVIVPLIFALFVAILLNPIVNFLTKRKVPRVISIFIALLTALIVIGGLVAFMAFQISMFSKSYPELRSKYKVVSTEAIDWFETKFNVDDTKVNEWIAKVKTDAMTDVTGVMGSTLMAVSSAMVGVVIIPVYIFLILYYEFLLLAFVKQLFNTKHHKDVADVLQSVRTIISSYLRGLLIEGAIVAVLNIAGLFILGVEYAVILGVTGAILNVIPYIGGIIAIALPMIIALLTKGWVSSLLVLVVYSLIQFIDNHYLIPYIVASKVKVNALVALIVVLIGDLVWGIPGMFLSIPLTALVKVIFDHIEPMKPWGYLLGDTVPPSIKLPFAPVRKK